MEKRLFIAIFLSLVVVFGFQTVFAPKNTPVQNTPGVSINAYEVKGTGPVTAAAAIVTAPVEKALTTFKEKEFKLENGLYQLSVSNKGGNINSIHLKDYDYLSPVKSVLGFEMFDNAEFQMDLINKGHAKFIYKSSDWHVVKEVTLNQDHTISTSVRIENVSSAPKTIAGQRTDFIVDTSRLDTHNVQSDFTLYEYSIKTDKRIIRKDNARNFTEKWNKEETAKVEWTSFRDKYFVTIVKSEKPEANYLIKMASDKELRIGTTLGGTIVDPGAALTYNFKIYAGPQRLDVLNKADKEFTKVMVFSNWGWLDAISKLIYWLLGTLHQYIPVWGLCIIVISLIVYGLMYPLTAKSLVSMKQLQVLQPKMKELQEKYKSNPERLNKEVVELYRIHKPGFVAFCVFQG